MADGKVEEAARSYRQALALDPDFADAYINLGNALDRLGKSDEAIATYQKALELDPDLAGAHYNLGDSLEDHQLAASD